MDVLMLGGQCEEQRGRSCDWVLIASNSAYYGRAVKVCRVCGPRRVDLGNGWFWCCCSDNGSGHHNEWSGGPVHTCKPDSIGMR